MKELIQLNFIKTFCSEKDTVKRIRRQATDKVFAYDTSNKGQLSKIHRELLQVNNKNTTN